MSIFSFLKDVGKKLMSGGASPESTALQKELDAQNLGTEGVKVTVEGDKVILTGNVKDRETLEKAVLAVGNSEGIAAVDVDGLKIDGGDTESSRFYTVKSGDNLSKISKAMYGDPNQYNVIFEANKPMLTHPDKIYPGQVLRIPPLS